MKIKRSIQFKAAFLMLVFSLNSVIGFACAVGIDMSFNTANHEEEATEEVVHIHKDGKKHVHQEAKHHDETDKDHHKKDSKDNCCTDKVIKFNEIDKSALHSFNAFVKPIFFTLFLASFYNTNILYQSYIDTGIKYFVRSHHPPIPDIRIAIRSFQI